MFKRHLPPASLFPLDQDTVNFDDHTYSAIRFTNPVFTKPTAEGISAHTQGLVINDELDPAGILRKSQGSALYLDDNAIHVHHYDKPYGYEVRLFFSCTHRLTTPVQNFSTDYTGIRQHRRHRRSRTFVLGHENTEQDVPYGNRTTFDCYPGSDVSRGMCRVVYHKRY